LITLPPFNSRAIKGDGMKTENKIIHSPTGHLAEILKELSRIALKESSVLFIGETGTGKELLAEYTVEHSLRKDKPYHKINCVGLSESVIESELFGHVKGAFTGATHDKTGIIEASNGGTLLLDELGVLKRPLQAKFLRVIEEQEFQKVGSTETKEINVRFIAATNREKKIIPDLKARFEHTIIVSPLEKRTEDLPYLLHHFLKDTPFDHIEVEALWCLMKFKWDFNIRQLQNVLAHAGIKREVKESENPKDPSNKILCGFHLPDDITDEFHLIFDKFRNYTNFNEMIQKKYHVKVFHSNHAASYWMHDYPEFIVDNSCLCLPLDNDLPRITSEMGADCSILLSDNVEKQIDKIIEETEDEVDLRIPRIVRELYFYKKPTYLFDLPWKQAKEKFPMIYYLENRKRYPELNKTELGKQLGVDRKTIRKWEVKISRNQLKSSKKQNSGK